MRVAILCQLVIIPHLLDNWSLSCCQLTVYTLLLLQEVLYNSLTISHADPTLLLLKEVNQSKSKGFPSRSFFRHHEHLHTTPEETRRRFTAFPCHLLWLCNPPFSRGSPQSPHSDQSCPTCTTCKQPSSLLCTILIAVHLSTQSHALLRYIATCSIIVYLWSDQNRSDHL